MGGIFITNVDVEHRTFVYHQTICGVRSPAYCKCAVTSRFSSHLSRYLSITFSSVEKYFPLYAPNICPFVNMLSLLPSVRLNINLIFLAYFQGPLLYFAKPISLIKSSNCST